jgi:hypothetical protein
MLLPRIIILGKSNDDRGHQLESLTRTLLTMMGHRNVHLNTIGSGGEEIDVTANYVMQGLGGERIVKVLCECKAHNYKVDLTDWLKFLGKIYEAEAREGQEVSGYFIALSGVNGNVVGSYDDLRRRRGNVRLLSGEELLSETSRILGLAGLDTIAANLRRLTERQYLAIVTAYYDGSLFPVPIFEDRSYTILNAQGDPLPDGERLGKLRSLVEAAIELRSFVDLREEAQARERANLARKIVLTQLMLDDGETTLAHLSAANEGYSIEELRDATSWLAQQGWLLNGSERGSIRLPPADAPSYISLIAEVYKFLIMGQIPRTEVFGCAYYDAHIDEALVAEIQRVQGGLPLGTDDVTKAIRLLRLSPGALASVLHPQPLIAMHRLEVDQPTGANIDTFDRSYFFSLLYRCLQQDYANSGLSRYFHVVRGIHELETRQTVIAKSKTGLLFEGQTRERTSVFQGDEELGGVYVVVAVLDDAPEPWEWPSTPKSDSTETIGSNTPT